MSDFDFDTKQGLPEVLPQGERLLWQGQPDWRSLAVSAFHVRKVMIYFAALAILQGVARLADGATLAKGAQPFLWFIPMGLVATGILILVARLCAYTTTYTLTTKRVVMKIGMALPVTFNIPFKQIDGAFVGHLANGTGDLCFRFGGKDKIAYLLLWPHARRWHFSKPQATFRAIPNVDHVANLAASSLTMTPVAEETNFATPHLMAAE
jgi:Bacterial PH domain